MNDSCPSLSLHISCWWNVGDGAGNGMTAASSSGGFEGGRVCHVPTHEQVDAELGISWFTVSVHRGKPRTTPPPPPEAGPTRDCTEGGGWKDRYMLRRHALAPSLRFGGLPKAQKEPPHPHPGKSLDGGGTGKPDPRPWPWQRTRRRNRDQTAWRERKPHLDENVGCCLPAPCQSVQMAGA